MAPSNLQNSYRILTETYQDTANLIKSEVALEESDGW
jgi:hypothetical protein